MTTRGRPSFWCIFSVAWLLLSILAACWAIATPIGASPDEPAHLIKAAATVRGELLGVNSRDGQVMRVPEYIAFSKIQTCYAFKPNTSAKCMSPVPGDPDQLVLAPTTAGLYNPVYYALVGWPSLLSSDSSGIYWMRIVSGVMTSLMLALAFALLAVWRRPILPTLGLILAITPMVLFLNSSVNPNSLEIAATLTTFVGVLTVLKEPKPDRLAGHSLIVFVAAALAANMRGLSLLWLAVAILVPFTLVEWERITSLLKKSPVQLAIAGTAAAVIAAALWLATTNSLGVGLPTSQASDGAGIHAPPITGFTWNLLSTFEYAQGMIGIFGWLDTPAPLLVYFIWSALAGGLLLAGFIMLRGRQLTFVGVLTAALLLLPPILQALYVTNGGIIWQGRYILPIFVCVVVAAASVISDQLHLDKPRAMRLVALVLALWLVAQFASFATALRRYAVGLDIGWAGLTHPQWSPPGGVLLSLSVFGLVLCATTLSLWFLLRPAFQLHLASGSKAERPAARTD